MTPIKNLYDALTRHNPDKIALNIDKRTYTYKQLLIMVDLIEDATPAVELITKKDLLSQLVYFLKAQKEGRKPVIVHADIDVNTLHIGDVPAEADFGVVSSGTTGVPKVFWRTYDSWAHFFPIQNDVFHMNETSVLFIHGSLSFTGNLNALTAALHIGASVVTTSHKNPKRWLELLTKVTHMYMVPSKLRLLGKAFHAPLEHMEVVFTGSQMIDARLIETYERYLPKAELIFYYGASELNYITYVNAKDWLTHPNTIGKPFPEVSIDFRDDEMFIATKGTICGIEGPYSVGDHGHLDEDGYIIFAGRKTAMLNKGGYKIWLPSIESKVQAIRGISDVVAVKIADELRGEELGLALVLDDDADPMHIREALHHTLLPVEQPKKIIVLDELPFGENSKVDIQQIEAFMSENHH